MTRQSTGFRRRLHGLRVGMNRLGVWRLLRYPPPASDSPAFSRRVEDTAMRGSPQTGLVGRALSCARTITDGASFLVNNGRVLELADFGHGKSRLACGVTRYENCLIAPSAAGLHDAHGRPIVESYLRRDSGARVEFPLGEPQPILVAGSKSLGSLETAAFIPHVDFEHFGHMLTETAGWFSPWLESEGNGLRSADRDVVFVLGGASARAVDRFRGVFDLPRNGVMSTLEIRDPLRCRTALVARPTCINRHGIHEAHFRAVKRLVNRLYGIGPEMERRLENIEATSAKTYLSRSMLPAGTRTIRAEEDLEARLAARGWRVVHPETLSIVEQLATLKQSAVVAGHVGSAFHLLMYFGTTLRDSTVIGLGMGTGRMNSNFSSQFHGQALRFKHLCCLRTVRSGERELRFTLPLDTVVRNLEELARTAVSA